MLIDVAKILSNYGTSTVQKIQQNLAASGSNASGTTSRSLKFTVERQATKDILKITGRPFFMAVETGRKPTSGVLSFSGQSSGTLSLVDQIQLWLQSKGMDVGAAYAIANSIHKKGTKLYQKGGRKDIVSNVINESLFAQIEQDILKQFAGAYLLAIKQAYDNGN